jgi:hypothetical protein
MSIATLFRKQATPEIASELDERALDQLFRKARTHNGWQPIGVSDNDLGQRLATSHRVRPQPRGQIASQAGPHARKR